MRIRDADDSDAVVLCWSWQVMEPGRPDGASQQE